MIKIHATLYLTIPASDGIKKVVDAGNEEARELSEKYSGCYFSFDLSDYPSILKEMDSLIPRAREELSAQARKIKLIPIGAENKPDLSYSFNRHSAQYEFSIRAQS